MSEAVDKEFQRILSNPPNEIISDSLLERLKVSEEKESASIYIGADSYSCSLESITFGSSFKTEKLALQIRSEVLNKLVDKEANFTINCGLSNLESFTKSQIGKIDCFKYQENTYIVEFTLESQND